MCIFTVKTLIKYYTKKNTPVYTSLLDVNKASDRVNHWTLFAKCNCTPCSAMKTHSAYTAMLVLNATGMHKLRQISLLVFSYLQWCTPR